MKSMLVACECSSTIRNAFAKLGWDAWSCDLQDSVDGGQHLKCDVQEILGRNWTLVIAHPPCTYLAFSGLRWMKEQCPTRYPEFQKAVEFFRLFFQQDHIPYICVENPIVHKWGLQFISDPTQVIQPWQFGDEAQKTTWLWLKNLPLLSPTKIVSKGEFITFKSGKRMSKWLASGWDLSAEERRKFRAKTFQGIADAMAEQWTKFIK